VDGRSGAVTARRGGPASTRAPGLPRLARAVLRFPLFYKILVANCAIVVLGAVLGTAAARRLERPDAAELPAVLVVGVLAAAGVAVTLLVNALILRVALAPLQQLEATAGRVSAGDLDARAPRSALADRELDRLTSIFNGMLDSLALYRQRLRDTAARALRAEEEERLRIARELHDDTAQTLAALLIRLRLMRNVEGEAARAALEELRVQLGEAIERVRRFARGLRPPALDDLGLVPALEAHVRGLVESGGVPIRLEAEPIVSALSPEAELALYRIAQEALSNAVRHAGASEVRLAIRRAGDEVRLTVTDDGAGFDPEALGEARERGLGLFGMHERAAYVGGAVEVRARPGAGTTVEARVPVHDAPTPYLEE
jgi:two-component system sensor histidine kinase UhpB